MNQEHSYFAKLPLDNGLIRQELLISGFVRKNPSIYYVNGICKIILEYYNDIVIPDCVMLWSGSYGGSYQWHDIPFQGNHIHFLNLMNLNLYKLNIKMDGKDDKLVQNIKQWDYYGASICTIDKYHEKTLPSYLQTQYNKYNNNFGKCSNNKTKTNNNLLCLVRTGGSYLDGNKSIYDSNCEMIVFESNKLYQKQKQKKASKKASETLMISATKTKTSTENILDSSNTSAVIDTGWSKIYSIDAYSIKLPQFPIATYLSQSTFNPKYDSIYEIGGCGNDEYRAGGITNKGLNTIHKLCLTVDENDELKWQQLNGKLNYARGCFSVINNNDYTNLFIVGGTDKWPKTIEMYNYKNDQCINVCDMNVSREWPGCCWLSNEKMIIGGGRFISRYQMKYIEKTDIAAMNTFEIFDLIKQKCQLLDQRSNNQYRYPYIWKDKCNPNIIFVTGQNFIHNEKNLELFPMEWIDLRDSNRKWQCIKDKNDEKISIESMLKIPSKNRDAMRWKYRGWSS